MSRPVAQPAGEFNACSSRLAERVTEPGGERDALLAIANLQGLLFDRYDTHRLKPAGNHSQAPGQATRILAVPPRNPRVGQGQPVVAYL